MSEMGGRGMQIVLWGLAVCLLLYGVQAAAGLKYVQGVVWPTDLYAFEHGVSGPIDVAVLGSSRASFSVSPSAVDLCLSERLGRATQTVNLARTFATARTTEQLSRALLAGERTPRLVVLAVGPEFFNEYNHQTAVSTAANADLQDLPAELLASRGLADVLGALRPLTRGPENLSLFLAGRHEGEAHLRWMMLHHGGGQFCYDEDGGACRTNNAAVMNTLRSRWNLMQTSLIPRVREERFTHYAVGDGLVADAEATFLARTAAEGTQVVLARVPLHHTFAAQIPPEVDALFTAHLEALAAQHPHVSLFVPSDPNWPSTRNRFIDPDHLSDDGSKRFSSELCLEALVPLLRETAGSR